MEQSRLLDIVAHLTNIARWDISAKLCGIARLTRRWWKTEGVYELAFRLHHWFSRIVQATQNVFERGVQPIASETLLHTNPENRRVL